MTDFDSIQMCIDRVLEGDEAILAAERSAEENPANAMLPEWGLDDFFAPPDLEIAVETGKKWAPGRLLRVRFMDGDPLVHEMVIQVAQQWTRYANVQFAFGDDPQAEIRISFTSDRQSWSFVGTEALGLAPEKPTMCLGWLRPDTGEDECHRVVLHEFGHALGCIHEHQHPTNDIPWDKEKVYAFYAQPPNRWTRQQVDTNLFRKYAVSATQFSNFDPQSIMLYKIDKSLTDGSFEVGWNKSLSSTDKAFIGQVYPFDPSHPRPLGVDGVPVEAQIDGRGEVDYYWFAAVTDGKYFMQTGGGRPLRLELYGPGDMNKLLSAVGPLPEQDVRIETALKGGVYFMRVQRSTQNLAGQYTIAVGKSG